MAVQAKAGMEDGLARIETAAERREALPPDIKLGWLSLWIGESAKRTWLEVAAEVRESSFDILAFRGPMVYRMAAAHFTDGTQPTNPAALAALEGALVAVREMERAEIVP